MNRTKYLQHVNAYILSREHAWAVTTKRDERYRLHSVNEALLLKPKEQYEYQKARGLKPYSIKTLFIRITKLLDYLGGVNPYRQFMEESALLFKNAYKKEVLDVGYDEALLLISKITDPAAKAKALFDIRAGTRFFESGKIEDGIILGKGGKRRTLLSEDAVPSYDSSYSTYRNKLKAVGLKPHTLRKLTANRLLRKGMKLEDVMKVMGWTSLQTVMSYAQALDDDALKAEVMKAVGE